MVNQYKNTLLIGLTVLALAAAAWWLNPQRSSAQDGAVDPKPTVVSDRPPSIHYLIGIHDARARLGRDVPTGKGITVGHVEAGNGQYMPDINLPEFKNVTFVRRSGPSRVSGHATATARQIYGMRGLAPGIDVVHCYFSRDWMTEGYLNAGTDTPPIAGPIRVFTHSWISDNFGSADILRRTDWLVDTHDAIVCAGVNNGKSSPVPYLLGSAYNAIAVGTAEKDGNSSGGFTRIDTPGRSKPDIVGPRGLTSFTTPTVAAVAARLLQAADEMTDHAHRAGKPELIKAVLLTGAVKPRQWRASPGRSLDTHLGAGIVNFDHSLQVLQAGPAEPGRLPRRMGWDFREIEPEQTHVYAFGLNDDMGEAAITLTWNRRITGINAGQEHVDPTKKPGDWLGLPRTTDLNLKLIHIDDAGDEHELAVSQSPVDNLEHIYLKHLSPGRYRIEVSRKANAYPEPWDYALAWRVELVQPQQPDVDEDEPGS